jgi:4-aminobutyrate aminotransferase
VKSVIEKYNDYVITNVVKAVKPIVIERASGATVIDSAGNQYVDCFAGISVVNAGHCNPEVIAAAHEQMSRLVHCCSYLYHVEAVANLAEKLAAITPGDLKKTFFANSGAEAVEGAIKLARLYTGKSEIVALTTSFHGRTWMASSITGNASRKRGGAPYAPGVAFAPAPYAFRSKTTNGDELAKECARALEDVLRFCTSGDVAAFIAEPVLGEGGIIVPPPNYFTEVKKVLDEHGILFIADEVQSGFGRTGTMFAIEDYGVEPDILVTAKGIANGFPLGAFTTRDEIAGAFLPGDHLSTFGGNPVSCAAATANIDFLLRENLPAKAQLDGEYLREELQKLQAQFPLIGEVRGKGLMIGIELVTEDGITPAAQQAEAVGRYCFEHGLLVGVGGIYSNIVRIQPPLVITRQQIAFALEVLARALTAVSEAHSPQLVTAQN